MTKFARVRNLLFGLLMIAFAVFLFREPKSGPPLILLIQGIIMVAEGVGTIFFYMTMARHMVGGKKHFYNGILALDRGALLLAGYIGSSQMVLLYLLAVLALSGGIDVIRALESRKQGAPWKHRMISGIVSIAILFIGLASMRNPVTVVYIFCIGLLYIGINRIITAFRKTAVIYIPQ